MGKLSAFLQPVPAGRTKEVIVSDRFKDDDGKTASFVVQAITPEKNEEISKLCTNKDGNLDAAEYGNRLIVECTVEPNLRDEELCRYYGVMDPAMVPGIMFSIGEKQILQNAIMEINDLKGTKEKLGNAKNS